MPLHVDQISRLGFFFINLLLLEVLGVAAFKPFTPGHDVLILMYIL